MAANRSSPPNPTGDANLVERVLRRAMSLHQQGELAEAEEGYRAALEVEPDEFDALHLLGLVYMQQDRPAEAVEPLSRAIAVRPRSIEALSNLGSALFVLKRFEEALHFCNRILAISPNHVGALFNRAAAELALDRSEAAINSFDQALKLSPNLAPALFGRANALAALGRDQDALAAYNRLLTVAPQHSDALTRQGQVLERLGLTDAALESYDRALAAEPEHVEALEASAAILTASKRYEEALGRVDQLQALFPDDDGIERRRADLLLALAHADEALTVYEHQSAAHAGDARLQAGRARALLALNRFEDALLASDAALAVEPGLGAALIVRADALRRLDRVDQAITAYKRVFAVEPDHPTALGALIECYLAICDWDGVGDLRRALAKRIEEGGAVMHPSALLLLETTPREQFEWTRRYAMREIPPVRPLQPAAARERPQKLRIAYLSADFHRDGIGHCLADLIERHDRDRFEIIGISFGPAARSPIRARLAAAFDQFHDVSDAGNLGIAQLIAELQVGIAVDLMGFREGARPGVLAHRPAPIQVGYLGYPATMGTDLLDYLIADSFALPVELEPFFAEKIARLPGAFIANDTRSSAAATSFARKDAGLPDDGFVFCCFNDHTRIAKLMFDVWMRVLKAVPNGVLWLAPMDTSASARRAAANLRRAARARGVEEERLVFAAPAASFPEHLARYRLANLCFDTTPCDGHVTAATALWAGLPVVTCAGETFAGRVTGSLLNAAGLPELATGSLNGYEALAVTLANDPKLLKSMTARLADHNARVTMFDAERYRRQIEAAYLKMWAIYQDGALARSFTVEER